MNFIKSIFTIIGALVVLGLIFVGVKYGSSITKMDGKALGLYMNMADDVLTTGDPAKGMIIKRKMVIEEGTSKEEAIENAFEVMDEVAEEYGLMKVDEKTMPRDGKFMKDGGLFTHIRSYCSPSIADIFLTHSGEFVGFMPCRVGIVEDANGDIWLYTMNLDMMIHGGHTLPDNLAKYALDVKNAMVGMLEKGAAGEN
ncbi:MAG: Unknown protein [uncultured Sulfurovum sp.]|uniref:DUF302 domain-containing protein n=1 Tax=uncultured Sulfurovum sp. TaxID=269237 RepID=A0A6S6SD64_9BACT|nr:MAG: Unknown protein [uncultured Sulfurovum sp.]